MQVDADDLITALQDHSYELVFFFDRQDGRVKLYSDGMMDGEAVEEDFDIDEFLDDPRYEPIEGIDSRNAYRVMEEFVESLESAADREVLFRALEGSKPFRRFKDALLDVGPVRERWFKFEEETYIDFAKDWLKDHDIEADLVKTVRKPAES